MIASITHLGSFAAIKAKLQYNQSKVDRGWGTMLLDNTLSSALKEQLSVFKDVIESNNKVRKNLAFEVSINLPHGENIKDEKFLEVINEYLKELKYDNAPMIVYRHSDTQHKHVHVIVSHVDWEGKKINQYNLFKRSQKLCRKLEKRFDLKPTEYNKGITDEALNSKNARKYFLHKALIKGLKGYNTKNYLMDTLSKEQISILNASPMSNDQVRILLKDNKEAIRAYLSEKKLFNTLLKDELYQKVDAVLKASSDTNHFLTNLKTEGVYVRKVFKKGSPVFVYGLVEDSFYINDDRLGKKFTYNVLVNGKKECVKELGKDFTLEDQKKYIKRMVVKHTYKSKNTTQFSKGLNENNIELITYQNSGGIYGIGFKSLLTEDGLIIKGSDIDISWKDLQDHFSLNSEVKVNEIALVDSQSKEPAIEVDYNPPFVPLNVFHSKKGNEQEDFLTIRRKNKQNNKRGF